MTRVPVRKTYKLYVGGAFPRSESGRTYEAEGHNVAQASRKDLRDAVRAARGAAGKWAGITAYNRGQVLYRVAEMLEARATDLADVCSGADEVEQAVDRMVWYAGWTDKLPQVLGGANPVAGPYFNFTVPEPTGVIGIVAPREPALLGLVSRARARARGRQRLRRDRQRDAPAGRDRVRRGARHLRRPGRRRQPAHRADATSSRRTSPPTSTSTRSTSRGATRSWSGPRPTTSSGSSSPSRARASTTSRASSSSRRSGTRWASRVGAMEKPVVEVATDQSPPYELVAEDITVGEGDEARAGSVVEVHYVGVSWKTGQQFDASWDRGDTFKFTLGKRHVIPGWDQGVEGMRVGGRRRLEIPPSLAYGKRGAGGVIGPDETLVFVVDLVGVR